MGAMPAPPGPELPIAVFDSGIGGLTVLHECLVSLPHEDFVYLGDTARFPYGNRESEELIDFARELSDKLLERGAKLLVVACNSATAAARETLERELDGRVDLVTVVGPEARLAAAASTNRRVGLLATAATVASGAYTRGLSAVAPDIALHAVPCPELAPLIQAGGEIDERIVDCVEHACAPLKAAEVDTVILGCTHYPMVRPVIQRALGRGVQVVSSGEAIAEEIAAALAASGLDAEPSRRGSYEFLCSGDPAEFQELGRRFLQLPIAEVTRVAVAQPRTVAP